MNIPFPIFYPPFMGPGWFDVDRPYDEDAELTLMEEENKEWLNSITKKFMRKIPVESKATKPNPEPVPEPMEETGSDDDANDDAEVSEESHDVDEDEDTPTSESPQINNEDGSESPEDTTEAADLEVESTLFPNGNQNE